MKTQDRVSETIVSRSPPPRAETPRVDAEPPVRKEMQLPSRPVRTPLPPPAQAALAPVSAAGAPNGAPAAASPEKPLELAAIPVEKKPDLPTLAPEDEARLLARGKTLTATGDVSSARLAYEYAARRKSVDAMYALAQTYDPEMLAAWSVVGMPPDMKLALKWYGRAADLGHDSAGTRKRELEKLAGR